MRKLMIAALGAASLLATPGTANAVILQWAYLTDSGFSAFSPGGTPPNGVEAIPGSTNAALGLPSALRWGDGPLGPFSSLVIGQGGVAPDINGHFESPPPLITDGAKVDVSNFTHNNFAIDGSDVTLSSASVLARTFLTPLVPPGSPFGPVVLSFFINFKETPNDPSPGSCTVGSPPCRDIFVLDVVGAGFNPVDFSFNTNFFLGGDPYNVQLFINGLGFLSDGACAAASAANGCIGFTTEEGKSTTFVLSARIATQQFKVPEPASLSLLGFGLTVLTFLRLRRRRSASSTTAASA